VTTVWTGLAIGAIYSFIAIGYNVVLLASGVFNFAHAQFVMLGTFTAYVGLVVFDLHVALAVLFGAVVVGIVGVLEERIAIRPLIAKADIAVMVIATIGAGTLISGAVAKIWGTDPKVVPGQFSNKPIHIFGGTVQPNDLALIIMVLAIGIGLQVWSRSTRFGLASLASAENRRAAMLKGINIKAMSIAAFALAGIIAGLAGVLLGPRTYAVSYLGDQLALYGFVAIAIGGAGNQLGGLFGGFTVGLLFAFSERYMGGGYPEIMVLLLFLLILLIRPQGLFGRPLERVV